MTRGSTKDHISGYYTGESLSPEITRRLAALAEIDRLGESVVPVAPGRSLWPLRLFGVAASIALILSSVSLYVVYRRVSDIPLLDQDAIANTMESTRNGLTHVATAPRLVAMKFQIEGCPLAASTEPAFVQLVNKYCEQPVMFVRYDMTNEQSQRFSRNTAASLGVDWAYRGAAQSGTILLIDRATGRTLATLTNCEQLGVMDRTIEQALH